MAPRVFRMAARWLGPPLRLYKRLRRRLRERLGWVGPPAVVGYVGFGNGSRVCLGGRVLERDGVVTHSPDPSSTWRTFLAMVRRFRSQELPGVKVEVTLEGRRYAVTSDSEGYFWFELALSSPLSAGWHPVEISLSDPVLAQNGRGDVARILVPPRHADFAVVSDVDDTVVETHAADRLQMLRTVFLHDAHTRSPFPGVSELYRALVAGPEGRGENPIFYLSRSPWNLFDLFEAVLSVHRIPRGPLLLRDFSLVEAPSRRMGREHHKLYWLRRLLATFPELPFLFIGDSGQQDPEIYEQIALEHPGRVRAILIRDVTSRRRTRQVREMKREVGEEGVPMYQCSSSTELAARLAALGLIAPERVGRVEHRREVRTLEDAASPAPA